MTLGWQLSHVHGQDRVPGNPRQNILFFLFDDDSSLVPDNRTDCILALLFSHLFRVERQNHLHARALRNCRQQLKVPAE